MCIRDRFHAHHHAGYRDPHLGSRDPSRAGRPIPVPPRRGRCLLYTSQITAAIQDIAAEFEPYIIKQRRHFHKHPELSLQEVRTTSDIAGQLDAMNIPYEQPLETGLVATLRGTAPDAYREDGTPRRRLLMRADIDALPVTERTDDEFASVNEGCMHACGHDCHIAMMLGALQVLRHICLLYTSRCV